MTEGASRVVTLDPSGRTFTAGPGQRLLEAAREAGLWLPFECGWGSCGTCKATLVNGEVESLLPDAPAISERDARRGRVLLCQSAALTDVTVRPLRVEDAPPEGRATRRLEGTVTSVTEVGPSIVDLRVEMGEAVEFLPGQFAILESPEGLRRCYSLAGAPGESELRFVLKRYDGRPMSTWLSSRTPGDVLDVEAPYGDVWLRPTERGLLLIAGGTGISAVLSLAGEAAARHQHRSLTVVYGARTPADLALLDEARALADRHGAARVIPVVEEGAADMRLGRVTDVLDELGVPEHDVYLAGPPAMVDAVEAAVVSLGVQRDRLFVDRFG